MKNKFLLLSLLLLNGLTPSQAAHSSLNSPYLTHSVNTHVTPLQHDHIFPLLPASPFLPAMAPVVLQSAVVKMVLTYAPFLQGTLLVVGTAAVALVASAIQQSQAKAQVEQNVVLVDKSQVKAQVKQQSALVVIAELLAKSADVFADNNKISALIKELDSQAIDLQQKAKESTVKVSAKKLEMREALLELDPLVSKQVNLLGMESPLESNALVAKRKVEFIKQIEKIRELVKDLELLQQQKTQEMMNRIKYEEGQAQLITLAEIRSAKLVELERNNLVQQKVINAQQQKLLARAFKSRNVSEEAKRWSARGAAEAGRAFTAKEALETIKELKRLQAVKSAAKAREAASITANAIEIKGKYRETFDFLSKLEKSVSDAVSTEEYFEAAMNIMYLKNSVGFAIR